MSYTPHTWQTGETVTAEKLNAMEQGITGGGWSMLITLAEEADTPQPGWITWTMDKTWQQIHDAIVAGTIVVMVEQEDGYAQQVVISDCGFNGTSYSVGSGGFTTESPNGYPAYTEAPIG